MSARLLVGGADGWLVGYDVGVCLVMLFGSWWETRLGLLVGDAVGLLVGNGII